MKISDIILANEKDAELVLEALNDVFRRYSVVTLEDLLDLVGLPTNYTDHNWGWTQLSDVQIRQVDKGYVIDLPILEDLDAASR